MITKTVSTYALGVVAGVAAMTPELLTAVGAIIVASITAVGAVIVNILVAKRVDRVRELAEQNLKETEVVKGHVNSAATKAAEEIKSLREELRLMREVASEKKETAALLAQAAAAKPVNVPLVAEETLVKIQENTAETVDVLKDAKDVAINPKQK